MNRILWTRTISQHICPPWQCPSCKKGTISLVPKSLAFEETTRSKRGHSDPDFDPEWIIYSFTAWGKCSNESCKQRFAIAGDGGVEPEYTSNEGDWEYVDYFQPRYCHPMPNIIEVPRKCPDEVKNQLSDAFSLFWPNQAACANKIRGSLEFLLNHLGVPKQKESDKEKPVSLSLHDRINAYAANDPIIGSQLMALKWLGNTGSHDGEVSRSDILDAFEILEHTLEELINRRSERVAELTKKLAQKHGK